MRVNDDAGYLYSGLIAGNLTLTTVVVSINQLLLSRELQTPDELRRQMDDDRLAPVATLCSFFLRTATVTKLTAATLRFTTPEQEVTWDDSSGVR